MYSTVRFFCFKRSDQPHLAPAKFQVLSSGVHDDKHLAVEHGAQAGEIDLEGVDQVEATGPRNLDQGGPREIRAFPVEFGVDGDPLLALQVDQQGVQGRLVVDQPVFDPSAAARRGPRAARTTSQRATPLGPESWGKPPTTQASVPPNTLTASMPCCR